MSTDGNSQEKSRYDRLRQQFQSVRNDAMLNDITREVNQTTDTIRRLPNLIEQLATRQYHFVDALQRQAQAAEQAWNAATQGLTSLLDQELFQLRGTANEIEGLLNQAQGALERPAQFNLLATRIEHETRNLKQRADEAERTMRARYSLAQHHAEALSQHMTDALWSLDQWQAAGLSLGASEALAMACKAEWAVTGKGGDDPDGHLYLTNRHIIFEQNEKKGKVLGLFGGKKVQNMMWQIPLTQIEGLSTEKKGMFGGKAMLVIALSPGAEHAELPMEIKGGFGNERMSALIKAAKTGDFGAPIPELVVTPPPAPMPQTSGSETTEPQTTGPSAGGAGGAALGGMFVAGAVAASMGGGAGSASHQAAPAQGQETDADHEEALQDMAAGQVPPPTPPPGDTSFLPNFQWIEVPGIVAEFERTIPGDMREGIPPKTLRRTITMPTFYLSATLITNAQWQVFMDDPMGYDIKRWWEYDTSAMIMRRTTAYDSARAEPTAPRTNISYYDALAFCNWLSHRISAQVTLPSEFELDHAVRSVTSGWQPPDFPREFTISQLHDIDDHMTKSMTSRIVKGNPKSPRKAEPMNAYKADVGFRVTITNRALQPIPMRRTGLEYVEQLAQRTHNTLNIATEAALAAATRDPQAVQPLIQLLRNPNNMTRASAAFALKWLAGEVPVPSRPLIEALATEDRPENRNTLVSALVNIGAEALPDVQQNLSHSDPIVRMELLAVIGAMYRRGGVRDPQIIQDLLNALADEDGRVVARAIDWLTIADPAEVRDIVRPFADDPREEVRAATAITLKYWGENVSLEVVEPPQLVLDEAVTSHLTAMAGADESGDEDGPEPEKRASLDVILPGWRGQVVEAGRVEVSREVRTGMHETQTQTTQESVERFEIGQHMITIGQFDVFIDDPKGYHNRRWWEFNLTAMQDRQRSMPPAGQAGQPRDHVSFWTCVAYCWWLGSHTGEFFHLPTEAEWQHAMTSGLAQTPAWREWTINPGGGYRIPVIADVLVQPIIRGAFAGGKGYLVDRTETIPLSVQEQVGFRLVRTGQPFQQIILPEVDVEASLTSTSRTTMDMADGFYSLARSASPDIVAPMLELLEGDNPVKRFYAVFVLGWISDRVPVPIAPLVRHLTDENRIYNQVVPALIDIGQPAVPVLEQAVRDGEPALRERALVPLARIQGDAALPLLIDRLQNDSAAPVRSNVAFLLGDIGGPEAIAALQASKRDTDARVVQSIERALEKLRK